MLSVNGCVAVDSMALDSGTLNLSDKSEIIGQITASESTGIISNGDLTISDNLLLSGANTSLEVNGSLFHRAGYIKAASSPAGILFSKRNTTPTRIPATTQSMVTAICTTISTQSSPRLKTAARYTMR